MSEREQKEQIINNPGALPQFLYKISLNAIVAPGLGV